MENLNSHSNELDKPTDNRLQMPFEPVTLQRPMSLFKGMLGLKVKAPSCPDIEFLVQLTTQYPSHQAMIRDSAGEQFKNLENLIRGRNKASSTTQILLSQKLGISPDDIDGFVHANNEGPLVPKLLNVFHLIEGVYLSTYSSKTSGVVICPHCKQKLTTDAHEWWADQKIGIGQPECLFIERLLKAVIGGYLLIQLFNKNSNTISEIRPSNLACSRHHPIGNWLDTLKQQHDCESLDKLSVKLEVQNINFSHGLLKKWSCGQVLMPFIAAEKMIDMLSSKKELQTMHIMARALALATDFVASVTSGSKNIDRKVAQEIIYQRLLQLELNVRLIPESLITKSKLE